MRLTYCPRRQPNGMETNQELAYDSGIRDTVPELPTYYRRGVGSAKETEHESSG